MRSSAAQPHRAVFRIVRRQAFEAESSEGLKLAQHGAQVEEAQRLGGEI